MGGEGGRGYLLLLDPVDSPSNGEPFHHSRGNNSTVGEKTSQRLLFSNGEEGGWGQLPILGFITPSSTFLLLQLCCTKWPHVGVRKW